MLILASSSPRRAKLLNDAGLHFKVIVSDIDEESIDEMKPVELVKALAYLKAKKVANENPEDIVIGADTMVVYLDEAFGKPVDEDDAYRMLRKLSGETHKVYSAVSIIKGDVEKSILSEADVTMKELSDLEIRNYIETKEPMDKAGAYAIQGEGGNLVDHYSGDYFTIVGLPLKEVLQAIKELEE